VLLFRFIHGVLLIFHQVSRFEFLLGRHKVACRSLYCKWYKGHAAYERLLK
jgi:hypothetical protein